jgi:hypothetical protein
MAEDGKKTARQREHCRLQIEWLVLFGSRSTFLQLAKLDHCRESAMPIFICVDLMIDLISFQSRPPCVCLSCADEPGLTPHKNPRSYITACYLSALILSV